jgi:hypothetical protein
MSSPLAAGPVTPLSSISSLSCSLAPQELCSVSPSPQSFSLSQEAADALLIAVDAKAALEAAKEHLVQATAVLDQLVEAGLLIERNLPVVSGYTVYRQEGRASWSYPDSIKQLEAQLKKRKQLAEQLGDATQKRGQPFWTIKEAEKVF